MNTLGETDRLGRLLALQTRLRRIPFPAFPRQAVVERSGYGCRGCRRREQHSDRGELGRRKGGEFGN